jgi:hypothetical protein
METITIKIEGLENVSFIISLLQKFNFVKGITVNKKKVLLNTGLEVTPIEWADKLPSIDDFAGIWSDRSVTLNDLRTKGWVRLK